jgi:hypothetical protein
MGLAALHETRTDRKNARFRYPSGKPFSATESAQNAQRHSTLVRIGGGAALVHPHDELPQHHRCECGQQRGKVRISGRGQPAGAVGRYDAFPERLSMVHAKGARKTCPSFFARQIVEETRIFRRQRRRRIASKHSHSVGFRRNRRS